MYIYIHFHPSRIMSKLITRNWERRQRFWNLIVYSRSCSRDILQCYRKESLAFIRYVVPNDSSSEIRKNYQTFWHEVVKHEHAQRRNYKIL